MASKYGCGMRWSWLSYIHSLSIYWINWQKQWGSWWV